MSGLDLVARGIARRAGAARPALFGSFTARSVPEDIDRLETAGYGAVGRGQGSYIADELADAALAAAHPRFVFQTANGRYFRLLPSVDGMIAAEQGGAIADGVTPCGNALSAALSYCDAVGASGIQLGAGTYALDNGGGLAWNHSGMRMAGEGMSRTVLRQINHARNDGSALSLGSCEQVRFSDLTLHGADGFGTLYSNGAAVKQATFERVRFTSDPQSSIDGTWFGSTNGVRWVCEGTAVAENITFADCIFEACGRMGVEFQNHTGDSVARYRNISLIRPKFIDIGGANSNGGYSAGMGISLSGYGDGVTIEAPYFDNIRQVCLEIVGASRVKVSDIRVRHDTLGAGLIQATNFRPMYGNVIDGLRWTTPEGDAILSEAPPVHTTIRLDNWNAGCVRNVHLNVTGDRALRLGVNYPTSDTVIEQCVLNTDNAYVIENFQSPRNTIRANRLSSTSSGTSHTVAVFGDDSVDCLIDGNVCAAPNASSWTPLLMTGNATARFTDTNSGKPLFATGEMVMASGTKYVGVDHGLGSAPTSFGVTAKGNVGNTNSAPWSGVASNVINAQVANNVTNNVTFSWWAKVDYGNI